MAMSQVIEVQYIEVFISDMPLELIRKPCDKMKGKKTEETPNEPNPPLGS